ncbi:MAG: LysR family transcriptional regulator [Alphaproteobacteria bacterium]|nr:LysR family transcriptional regulator [Alphaproteobacteria bacterium]
MRHATFRQLRVFDAIVRNASFSRAAEEMHLSQPTLSVQVRKIGDSVGQPLFEQIGKRIFLTEAGRALHVLCGEVFASIDRFEMAMADLKGMKTGRLRVAAVTTAEYFLPRLLGPFCNRHPGIDMALELVNRERALERLRANLDDFYVFGAPPSELDVVALPFVENPLVVVAPADHRLCAEREIDVARMAAEPILLREPGSGTRQAAERFFAAHGLKPRIRMELGSNEAIKQAVMGGLGLAILSRHALEGFSGVAELDVAGFPLRRQWYLVWPNGKQHSVAARALLDHLKADRPA